MGKIIRLTERDLTRLITKVIKEQEEKQIELEECIEAIKDLGFFAAEGSSENTYSLLYVNTLGVGGRIKRKFGFVVSLDPEYGPGYINLTTVLEEYDTEENRRKSKKHPENELIKSVARKLGVKVEEGQYDRYYYTFLLNDYSNPNPKIGAIKFLELAIQAFEDTYTNPSRAYQGLITYKRL